MFDACVYFNVNALARDLARIWDNAFMKAGMSPAHGYLLMLVLEKPGIGQKEISETLHLKPSTVSRFIDSLQTRELISRKQNGKESHVIPTEKGYKMKNDFTEIVRNINETLLQKAPKEKTDELLSVVTAYRKILS